MINFVGGYNISKKVIIDTFQHYSLNFIFHNTQPPLLIIILIYITI